MSDIATDVTRVHGWVLLPWWAAVPETHIWRSPSPPIRQGRRSAYLAFQNDVLLGQPGFDGQPRWSVPL
jgi:hypothetical protein